jgi:16S rRNA (guanine527-N7)-methyltransferase
VKQHPDVQPYIDLLMSYNEHTNIYSKKAYDDIPFHVQDSINIADLISNVPKTITDMGSGSGLPSVVIAIKNPKNNVIAVESKDKKCRFLHLAKKELQLENLKVVQMDILQFSYLKGPRPDIITCKAFAPYDKALAYAKKLSKPGSTFIMPIGRNQQIELREVKKKPFTILDHEIEGHTYLIQKL